jgi:peptide deformylase
MPQIRKIAQLGQSVLRTPAMTVALPASAEVRALVDDMLATMLDADGVGIAAPQVFKSLAIFIVASRPNPRYPNAPHMEPEVVVNPELLGRSEHVEKGWEGCLSIPGIRGEVPRPDRIKVRYQTLEGETRERDFDGFVARVFLHELDHLHGIVFLDRLESTKDIITEQEFQARMDTDGSRRR